MEVNEKSIVFWKASSLLTCGLAIILLFSIAAFAQSSDMPRTTAESSVANTANVILQPRTAEYRSIKIGTTSEEVRNKLGKATIDDKDGFYYRFSDEEFAQIRLDPENNVRLIAVTYSGKNAPKVTDVFGNKVKVETKPDGSIYKLVRYPNAGYWLAYSSTASENPTITVTMQELMHPSAARKTQ